MCSARRSQRANIEGVYGARAAMRVPTFKRARANFDKMPMQVSCCRQSANGDAFQLVKTSEFAKSAAPIFRSSQFARSPLSHRFSRRRKLQTSRLLNATEAINNERAPELPQNLPSDLPQSPAGPRPTLDRAACSSRRFTGSLTGVSVTRERGCRL